MINRALIRIKVVQMLYSYLLTCNSFKIEPSPQENSTKDKKYAYKLYLDLLMIIMRVSGIRIGMWNSVPGVGDNRYLSSNKMIKALQADSEVRKLMTENKQDSAVYDAAVESIYNEVVRSSAYKSYIRKKTKDINTDVEFWLSLVATVIANNKVLLSTARGQSDFTLMGFDSAISLLSDTLKSAGDSKLGYLNATKALQTSLDKSYELYKSLLLLPVEITRLQDTRLENARCKFLPTMEDLNPNTKFVDNRMVKLLVESKVLNSFRESNDEMWITDPTLLRKLLDKITESELYAEYMQSETSSLKADCDFWRGVLRNIILPSDELVEALEFSSVYWNDDVDIVGTFVLKTFKRLSSDDEAVRLSAVMPQFKDEIDACFGAELFEDTVKNFDRYREYVERFVDPKQWDSERLAFMDVVIMATAISELINFPEIPIPVTLNEFIEIANSYSTPRSGQFVNGILYSVINSLKNEGLLLKN